MADGYLESYAMKRTRRRAFHAQGGLCFWCAEGMVPNGPLADTFDRKLCTGDHLVQRAMGGLVTDGNIVAACQGCNHLRGTGKVLESKLMAAGYVFALPGGAAPVSLNRSAGRADGIIYSVGNDAPRPALAAALAGARRQRNGAVTYTAEGWPIVPLGHGGMHG